jgi:putative ABC transport system substrate-binding protein
MRRRDFIKGFSAAATMSPLAARAQQAQHAAERIRQIGVLAAAYTQADREGQIRVTAFHDALERLGWTDGRDIRIEHRWAGGDAAQAKVFAAELVRSVPDVLVANGNPLLIELQRLTSTIPIVFTQVSDPVGSGIVASLARPGSNITGFSNFEPEMGGKWVEMLKKAAPKTSRVAVVFGSDSRATVALLRSAEAVTPNLGVELTAVDLYNGIGIERALAEFASQADGGLIVTRILSPLPTARRSSHWRHTIACRQFIHSGIWQRRAGSCPTGLIRSINGEGRQHTSIAFCEARKRVISQFRLPPGTNLSSISRLQRHLI